MILWGKAEYVYESTATQKPRQKVYDSVRKGPGPITIGGDKILSLLPSLRSKHNLSTLGASCYSEESRPIHPPEDGTMKSIDEAFKLPSRVRMSNEIVPSRNGHT
jgi:hypothetical protein